MKALTLRKDSFTTFVDALILCLGNKESSQEIPAASERYLITNSGIKAATIPNMPSVKLAHLYTLDSNIYTRKNSPTKTIETLEKGMKYVQS